MSTPTISEATIRRNATPQSFERGEAYYRSDSVVSLTQRGNTLQAEVEGSEDSPYHVTVRFDGGGLTATDCTCAYNFEGWCKHIVATLLVCVRQPDSIEERPTLVQLLDRLDPVQTQRLVQDLVAEQPELIDAIDRHVSLITAPIPKAASKKSVRRTSVDPAPFRREVRQVFRSAVGYWEYEGGEEDPVTEDLLAIVQKARDFTEQGDGNNALVILEAITVACVEDWDDVADYGADTDEIAQALDEAWTEAILSADLAPEDTVDLRVNLENWQDEWSVHFSMSLEALRQGWDDPALQNVLKGTITEFGAWHGEPPDYADDLALIRLKILDRQERYQEYLYLAEAEGQTQQYLTMLGRLGRTEDAMQVAQTQMTSMEEAFALAQTLREQGALEQALQIAQTGLSLPGNCGYNLATWTSDVAEGLGNRPVALSARMAAFKHRPSFGDYQKVEELAGERWSTVKTELLAAMRTYTGWGLEQSKVDVFLHEGLIDDAIALVTDLHSYHGDLIHRVMDAAIADNPDWVIQNARRRAESIMDAKKAEYYYHAINWLKKVRAAYIQSGRQSEWSAYRSKLMATHARKYKLMAMLQQRDMV
ncbi:MAG: SWIM zinc finger domain-containing protein [Leptolyngbyaceae cyanobacterium RU_5_1]|nr:SWIM zinc finger domain-containing protein [Leptolyngbyaceae cyanobacterium RU_5_1]